MGVGGTIGKPAPPVSPMAVEEMKRAAAYSPLPGGGEGVPNVPPGALHTFVSAQQAEFAARGGGAQSPANLQGAWESQVINRARAVWPTLSLPERAAMIDLMMAGGMRPEMLDLLKEQAMMQWPGPRPTMTGSARWYR